MTPSQRTFKAGAAKFATFAEYASDKSGLNEGGATMDVAVDLAVNGVGARGKVARKVLKGNELVRDDAIHTCVFALDTLQMQPALTK